MHLGDLLHKQEMELTNAVTQGLNESATTNGPHCIDEDAVRHSP